MKYLQSLLAAFHAAGKSKAQISREAGLNDLTLRHYMQGTYAVPAHRRAKLSAAFGVAIDWPAYDAEFATAKAAAPPPASVPLAQNRPATAKKQQRPTAPAPTPVVRRFFGIPIIDDTNEATA